MVKGNSLNYFNKAVQDGDRSIVVNNFNVTSFKYRNNFGIFPMGREHSRFEKTSIRLVMVKTKHGDFPRILTIVIEMLSKPVPLVVRNFEITLTTTSGETAWRSSICCQGRLHKLRAGGAVLVPRANRRIFLLT